MSSKNAPKWVKGAENTIAGPDKGVLRSRLSRPYRVIF
jgi:hypothetical protein